MEFVNSLVENGIFHLIVNEISDIKSIQNLKCVFPHLHNYINTHLLCLTSDNRVYVNLKSFKNCKKLIISSNNILFKINKPIEFKIFKSFTNIKHINFQLKLLNIETQSVDYFDSFLNNLPTDVLHDKTYRLCFDVDVDSNLNTKTDEYILNYAYIFDRKYFTIANLQSFRIFNNSDGKPSRLFLMEEIINKLLKRFPHLEHYYCQYNKGIVYNYKGNNPTNMNLYDFNVTDKFKDNSFIFLIKADAYNEKYHLNDFVELLVDNHKKLFPENIRTSQLKIINRNIIYNIIKIYAISKKIISYKNNLEYINLWDDQFIKNNLPQKKEWFVKLVKNNKPDYQEYISIAKEFVRGKVNINNLVDLIINMSDPIDIYDKNKLSRILLPCQFDYHEYVI